MSRKWGKPRNPAITVPGTQRRLDMPPDLLEYSQRVARACVNTPGHGRHLAGGADVATVPRDPQGRMLPRAPLEQRFWYSIKKTDGCWEWQAGRYSNGYGLIYDGGRPLRTHRLAWELAHGPIPEGMYVCHHCDNPPCCRPDHLFLGTSADNAADAWTKGRRRKGNAKMTEEQVRELRRRYDAGEGVRALAKEFGIHHSVASRISTRQAWKDVQ
jgi:hypothetical protein